jgi:formate/nitrite transporter FocA (FNT family)
MSTTKETRGGGAAVEERRRAPMPDRADGHDGHGGRDVPPDGREPAAVDEEPKPLGQEAPEIVEDAAKIGGKRLDRSLAGDVMTSVIGGMSICFGIIAMAYASASFGGADGPSVAHLVGALAYPIGFVILLIGKSELFTENFLLPVTGVLERRGTLRQLGALWGITLVFNLVGAAVFAFLVSRPGVLDAGASADLIATAVHVVDYPFWTAFVKALFAGWLMTILTWLLLAAEGLGPRLFLIWLIGTLIILGEFTHVIISGAEVFLADFLGDEVATTAWLGGNFWPILAGNVIGGVVFVTLLQYVQAQYGGEGGKR